jgi:hypothetical protein
VPGNELMFAPGFSDLIRPDLKQYNDRLKEKMFDYTQQKWQLKGWGGGQSYVPGMMMQATMNPINRMSQSFYGWPYWGGGYVIDPLTGMPVHTIHGPRRK